MTATTSPPPRRSPHKPPRVQPIDPILLEYLYNKLHGKAVSTTLKVIYCSLYSEQEPWEIWEDNGGNELKPNSHLFVITKLKKLSTKVGNCNRHVRRIGRCGGSWQGEDSGLNIPNAAGCLLGVKKRFRYENKKGLWKHEQHGRWIMYQFVLKDNMLPPHLTDEYAICSFKKNHNTTTGEKRKKKDTESVVLPPRPPRNRNTGVAHPAINRIKKAKTNAKSVVLPPLVSQPLHCDSDKEKPRVVVIDDDVHCLMKPQQYVLALPAVVPHNINGDHDAAHGDDSEEEESDDEEDRGPGWIARFAKELLKYRLPSDNIDMEADPLMPNMQYNCYHA